MLLLLLLFLAALGKDHRAAAEGQIYKLDMALNSFDDRYDGCTKEMEKLVKTEYLKKELDKSEAFKKAWEAGEKKFTEERDNMAREYLIAMYVYTLNTVYGNFNNEVRTGKQIYEDKTFAWHSLHFLLTKALQMVKKQQNARFLTIYRGTLSKFIGEEGPINVGTTFRFGSFTSFSLNKGKAEEFARNIISEIRHCFEIKNYEGAELTKYSAYCVEEEVLIPPYEKFKVTAVRTNDWCDTVFVLKSVEEKSNLNCALIKEKTPKKNPFISKLLGCCGKGSL